MSYRLAGVICADKKKSARAGLLHDYGYLACTGRCPGSAALKHPAIRGAMVEGIGEKNLRRIVESHIFPIGKPPGSVEAIVVWLADKIDRVLDVLHFDGALDRQLNPLKSAS